jgi:hypothetical protein
LLRRRCSPPAKRATRLVPHRAPDRARNGPVSERYKAGKKVEQTTLGSRSTLSSQSATKGDIMEKTKSKAKRFLKLDRLGLRIAHAQKYFAKHRKERAERAFERSMLQAT